MWPSPCDSNQQPLTSLPGPEVVAWTGVVFDPVTVCAAALRVPMPVQGGVDGTPLRRRRQRVSPRPLPAPLLQRRPLHQLRRLLQVRLLRLLEGAAV